MRHKRISKTWRTEWCVLSELLLLHMSDFPLLFANFVMES